MRKYKKNSMSILDRLILLSIIIMIIGLTLKANCEYYVNEFNHSKIRFETMQEVEAPYQITIDEKTKIIYFLENAKIYCRNKEYYEILIKFYEEN